MYYFYSPEMFVPFPLGLKRNISYAYMLYHSFYYGDYVNALPYALHVP
ncbi:polysaccharide deacetylase family protein, partial [Bacillus toyonensis]